MSSPGPDPARLEALRDKFDNAAEDFPGVDAVVVWRPEVRIADAERTVLDFRHTILEGRGRSDHQKMVRFLTGLIPPPDENFPRSRQTRRVNGEDHIDIIRDQCRLCFQHTIFDHARLDQNAPNGMRDEGWSFVLFNRDPVTEQTPWRRFDSLARDAAQLVLNGCGRGDSLLSSWLINLADRCEPLDSTAERAVLLSRGCGQGGFGYIYSEWRRLADPDPGPRWRWRPHDPDSRPSCEPGWWVVRFNNVSRLSRVAVDAVIRQEQELRQLQSSRIRYDSTSRSVWLDEKQLANGLDAEVYAYFQLLAESYPNPITFAEMEKRSVTLNGVNQTRLKEKLPAKLGNLIARIPGKGHVLELPNPR
ncbi:MAG: hypothetical protein L0241_11080 [Planctomycetia bacterium]|nr:hypothetical protein [Planctomycetia bacterium]